MWIYDMLQIIKLQNELRIYKSPNSFLPKLRYLCEFSLDSLLNKVWELVSRILSCTMLIILEASLSLYFSIHNFIIQLGRLSLIKPSLREAVFFQIDIYHNVIHNTDKSHQEIKYIISIWYISRQTLIIPIKSFS